MIHTAYETQPQEAVKPPEQPPQSDESALGLPPEQISETLDAFYGRVTDCNAGVRADLGEVPPQLVRLVQLEAQQAERKTPNPDRIHLLESCLGHIDKGTAGSDGLMTETLSIADALTHAYGRNAKNPFYTADQRKHFREKRLTYAERVVREVRRTRVIESAGAAAAGALA
ncbi:MAG TPA: hypothetical protein VLF59_00940 [Candidatus Saccharimonadales bacterium]|nr:hypothetical protein [Candidatus Saccharimonadales bacterium]